MDWSSVLFSMIAAGCLTLAAVHFLVWLRQRSGCVNALFAILAVSTALLALIELGMLRARDPARYAELLRWYHVPVWGGFLALLGFARLYFQAGRLWLLLAAAGLRTLALAANFLTGVNLNYREITALRQVDFLGGGASLAVGAPNAWMLTGQLSMLLLAVFMGDLLLAVWRRGERRKAALLGGGTLLVVLAAVTQSALVFWGVVPMPLASSLSFTLVVAVMSHELSSELLRAGGLRRQLQEEKSLLEALFDSVPGMIYLYNSEGRLLRWNRNYERLTGHSAEELRGVHVSHWVDAEDLPRLQKAWEQVFSEGQASIELEIIIKGGARLPCFFTGVRVDFEGRPHMVGVGIDINAVKRAEAELTQQRELLAHYSRVETLGELAGALAHELNQPLGIILSNAQAAQTLLSRTPPDLAEVQEILSDIISADVRASDTIKRLRALMKRGATARQPVDLNDCVEEVLRLVREDLSQNLVQVEVRLEKDLPPVLADRIQVQQVLLNLLSNARDAMADTAPGRRRLIITTSLEGAQARITVQDQGCGLPAEVEKIFEPFHTTKPSGLGLGLPICRTLIAAHHGRLWAAQGEAGGAVFHLSLPVVQEEETA